jgi:hypothetical protein
VSSFVLIATTLLTWGPAPWTDPQLDPIAAKASALCRATTAPLDQNGRRLLASLERQLANETLGISKIAQDQIDTGDFLYLLQRYPEAEVLFVFPAAIAIPGSRFRARLSATAVPSLQVGPPVFFMELHDVAILRTGRRTALAFDYSSGPASPAPNGGAWTWGMGGRFCAVPRAHGRWRIYALSAVVAG